MNTRFTIVFIVLSFLLGVFISAFLGYNLYHIPELSSERADAFSKGFNTHKNLTDLDKEKAESWENGYSKGFDRAKDFYKYTEIYNESATVNFTGEVSHSKYKVFLVDTVEDSDTIGYSYSHNSTIFIESGFSGKKTDKICNHEVLHQLFPKFDHPEGDARLNDPLYYLDDQMDLEVCNEIVEKAQDK